MACRARGVSIAAQNSSTCCESKDVLQAVIEVARVYHSQLRERIDLSHTRNLVVTFDDVALIDAQGIIPQRLSQFWESEPPNVL